MFYAQITGGIVTAVTQTSAAIASPNMIAIASFDITLLGATWNGATFTRTN